MIDLLKLQKRILENKIKKGFPINDFEYDFNKILEEVEEAKNSIDSPTDLGEEFADIMIMCLGVAEMKGINMEEHLLNKMDKIERRKITKIDERTFEKEEGQ